MPGFELDALRFEVGLDAACCRVPRRPRRSGAAACQSMVFQFPLRSWTLLETTRWCVQVRIPGGSRGLPELVAGQSATDGGLRRCRWSPPGREGVLFQVSTDV